MTDAKKNDIYINKKYIIKSLDTLHHQVFNNYEHSKLSIYLEMLDNLSNQSLQLDEILLSKIKNINYEINRINQISQNTNQKIIKNSKKKLN